MWATFHVIDHEADIILFCFLRAKSLFQLNENCFSWTFHFTKISKTTLISPGKDCGRPFYGENDTICSFNFFVTSLKANHYWQPRPQGLLSY